MSVNDYDEELLNRIEELKDQGYFDDKDKEYGIAKLVVDVGVEALSPKQRVVWERGIVPILQHPINDEEAFQQALEKDWDNEARHGH